MILFLLNKSGARYFFLFSTLIYSMLAFSLLFFYENTGRSSNEIIFGTIWTTSISFLIPFCFLSKYIFFWYYVLREKHDTKLSFDIRFLDRYLVNMGSIFSFIYVNGIALGLIFEIKNFHLIIFILLVITFILFHSIISSKFISVNIDNIKFTSLKGIEDFTPYLEEVRVLVRDVIINNPKKP